MADIIQLLPDHVANQIAAGEVVQRPASVVKELLENAIDAGADQIKLYIKDAGKTLIQVSDNGKGMSPTDARLCFERHATSKIREAKDLFKLNTKGFRGEAMASIAAIAHVELKTRPKNQELGTGLKIEGSEIIYQGEEACAQGTSVAVKNLFFNIPARRNFLKSDTLETRHMVTEFQRVALAHQNIAFSMHHNQSVVYDLKPGNLKKRIVAVLGGKTNEKLVPVSEETDVVSIDGFIVKPEYSKKKRGEQFFFVNNRFVKSAYLHHAVNAAFEGLLGNGYHPSYFLFLNVPPDSIDINIHPTKTEIKFDNEKVLYAIIRASVKHSLGQFNIAPILDFNRDASMDTPYLLSKKEGNAQPPIAVDPDFNPFYTPNPKKRTSHFKLSESMPSWESLYTGIEEDGTPSKNQMVFEHGETTTHSKKTFQIHNKYLLSTIKSGVVLIHQHLAHQRILYEAFLTQITLKETASQQLLFPVTLSFNKEEIASIKNLREDLENTGFLFEKIIDEEVVIKGIPINLTAQQIETIFQELLSDVREDIPNSGLSQLDAISKSLAKSTAIKTGQQLNDKEQEALVNDLFQCKEPSYSPYGKKTFETLEMEKLDQWFQSKKTATS